MLDKIKYIMILLLISSAAWSDEVQVNPDHPDRYVVQKGDTLWDISGRFLTEPWRWPEIWKANPQIENPHLIYPGDVVSLTYEEGAPVMSVDRGVAGATSMGGRDVKLSPEIRVEDEGAAIPSIPIDAIRHFLKQPLVVSEGQMEALPYIVSNYEQRILSGPGNRVYVRGLSEADGRVYSVFRKGKAYRRGGTGELLGYEARYVGDAVVEQFGDPATAVVSTAELEVMTGDRLIPQSRDEVASDFIPSAADRHIDGSVISVVDGLSEIGQYQIVVLDVGTSNGLEVGNVLGVYQRQPAVKDEVKRDNKQHHPFAEYLGTFDAEGETVQLPSEYAGVVLVFRTFANVSYALVMEATAALHIQDQVRAM